MGKFTVEANPVIDKVIEDHLSLILDSTLKQIEPVAMLLAGSFGRGEGAVYLEEGAPHFISDYEVCLISPNPAARLKVDQITREVANKIPLEVSLFWNTPTRIYNNRSRNLSFGKPQATIGMYELKAGSQIFYGDFDLNNNAIDPIHIPVSEGIRLIINRMMAVVEAWFDGRSDADKQTTLAKLFLACGDALLLKHGKYHYSYQERAKRFEHDFETIHKNNFDQEFFKYYQKSVTIKLMPQIVVEFSIIDALKFSIKLTRQLLVDLTGSDLKTTSEILKGCCNSIPLLYQLGSLHFLDRTYENLILGLRARRAGNRISYGRLPEGQPRPTPFQSMYGAIPALFWNLPATNKADQALINDALKFGQWALPPDSKPDTQNLTSALLRMWHTLG